MIRDDCHFTMNRNQHLMTIRTFESLHLEISIQASTCHIHEYVYVCNEILSCRKHLC